ncbi:RNA polymerase I subunit H [Carabus blaptoides fortunei]
MSSSEAFSTVPGFCPDCGAILPLLREKGNVTCYTCCRQFEPGVFGNMEVKYTIHFNSKEAYSKNSKDVKKRKEQDSDEGPVVDRRCQKCGNEKMSYATLQLRSADEGQTVFYTCTKCGYKETENS